MVSYTNITAATAAKTAQYRRMQLTDVRNSAYLSIVLERSKALFLDSAARLLPRGFDIF
jgi:hypothetical protein